MTRVAFSLAATDHLALELLSIYERKAMFALVRETIKTHLVNKDAYSLCVTKVERP